MSILTYECDWEACTVAFDSRARDTYRICVGSYSPQPFTNFVDLVEVTGDGMPVTRGILPLCDPATKIMYSPRTSDLFAVTSGDSLQIFQWSREGRITSMDGIFSSIELENIGSKAREKVLPMVAKKLRKLAPVEGEGEVQVPSIDTSVYIQKTFRLQSSVTPVAGTVATSFDWSIEKPSHAVVSFTGGILALFNIEADKEVACAAVHDDTLVYDVCFCDANTFASVGQDGSVRTLDQRDMAETIVIGEHPKQGDCFTRVYSDPTNDHTLACFGLNDTDLMIFDRRRPSEIVKRFSNGHEQPLNCASWRGDCIVTAGEDGVCNIWQYPPLVRRLTCTSPNPINGVAWGGKDFGAPETNAMPTRVAITTGTNLNILRV